MAPTALLDRLPASALLPGADGACLACGGAGWVVSGVVLKPIVCTCVATCPACGGSGYVAGGLEACACRVARERVALLGAAGLPWVGDAPGRPGRAPADLDAALAAWFDRYRPEDGWPWLLWVGPTAPLVRGLARLVLAAGVPVARADAGLDEPWRRVVAALDLDALGAGPAARLVHRCADEGLTLVAIARRAPYPDAGEGLEATLGDDVAVALLERAHVLGAGAVPP